MLVFSHYLYKLDGSNLRSFDMINGSETAVVISGLVYVSSLVVEDEKVIVEGLSDRSTLVRGVYDYQTNQIDTAHNNIMKEIVLEAMN